MLYCIAIRSCALRNRTQTMCLKKEADTQYHMREKENSVIVYWEDLIHCNVQKKEGGIALGHPKAS